MNLLRLLGDMTTYYDPNTNSYYSSSDATAAAGALVFIMLFGLVVFVVSYVIYALLLGRIFVKAGVPQWKAWVPVYSNWVMMELGDQAGFWAVLAYIPLINIVAIIFMYMAMYKIGLKFGKEGAFVLLAIFIPIVWFIWLAVDKSTWKGSTVPAASQANTAQ